MLYIVELSWPDREALRMTRAETAETRFPAIRGILSAGIYALELVTIVIVYVCFAEFSVVLPWINPTATPLWPPTGLALAVALLRGYRIWPALITGSFLAATLGGASTVEATFIAFGTSFAALAGAWLISRWFHGRETFRSPLDIAKFSLIAFVPTAMMSSAFAMAGVAFARDAGFEDVFATWSRWWLADGIETLLFTPVLLLWATKSLRSFSTWSLPETAAVVLVTAAVGAAAYSPEIGNYLSSDSDPAGPWSNRGLLGFLVLLPLMWSGVRGKQGDAPAAALVICGFAAWGFSSDTGPLPHTDLNESLLALAVLSIAVSVPSLVLGAAIAAHQETETRLLAVRAQLSEQLDYTKLASERAKRHFQTLLEGVVDHAVFLLDTSGRVATWNRAAQRIIGYSAEEIIGKHFGIFYRPDERRSGEPNRGLELAVRNGKYEVEGWRLEKKRYAVLRDRNHHGDSRLPAT